jgi:hypothetical protein
MLSIPLGDDVAAELGKLAKRHGTTPAAMAADILREAVIRAVVHRDQAIQPAAPAARSRQLCAFPGCVAAGTVSNGVRGDGPWYCGRHHMSARDTRG